MIQSKALFDELKSHDIGFYTGVPDSLLKDFCAYISDNTTISEHIIAANEGAAVALAAGHHLATGKVPLVYMQNSGMGNTINPLLSLADKEVYSIPMILMIGWRGEPGVKDEPQHIKQGRVQNAMLEALEIPYRILDASVTDISTFITETMSLVKDLNSPVAIVVRKGTFQPYKLQNARVFDFELSREMAIEIILGLIPDDAVIVSTTGMLSREVFELRERKNQGHQNDFLTVGSMGHCSKIALGIAMNVNKLVVCLDGDGAAIMHMGSLSVIAANAPSNFLHILINNGVHDSVGGQPTVGFGLDFPMIAKGCGYNIANSVSLAQDVKKYLSSFIKEAGPVFLEVKVKKGARSDLGRPTTTPVENKDALMNYLSEK